MTDNRRTSTPQDRGMGEGGAMSAADGAARAEAAEFIRREMQDGFLHPGIVAPGSRAHKALSTLVTAAQRPQPIEVTDAMVEAAAEAIWDTQWRRAVSLGVRERAQPWSGASVRTTAGIREDARAALTAALNTMKEQNP